MAIFFNLLAIGSIVAGMVLAFLHLTRGKRTLPFADDSHARTFGWGLLMPLLLMVGYAFREEPMVNGSLWLLVVMMAASAGWFYLAGSYRYSIRRWDMPLWQGVACAQFCGLFIVMMGSIFAISSEDNAREAYLREHEPARYAALIKQRQQEQLQTQRREQAYELAEKKKQAAENARYEEERYQKTCGSPERFIKVAQDALRPQLKSPSSAKFSGWLDAGVIHHIKVDPATQECSWVFKAYVDSQNGFGAMIRTEYMAEVKLLRDKMLTLKLVDLAVIPNR